MKPSSTLLAAAVLAACTAITCGGALSDGGQSGTGLSAIRGNVVAVMGATPDLADIRVSLAATNLATRTDAGGRFELRGETSGAAELRFERMRDGLFARTDVVVPAGGVLELQRIVLDAASGEAHPERQRVEFEGTATALDCAAGTILATSKDDEDAATVFTIEVASATIRRGDVLLACGDLRVGDRLEIHGETPDGTTLVNAEVVVEDAEDGPDGEEEADDAVMDDGAQSENETLRHALRAPPPRRLASSAVSASTFPDATSP